MAMHYHDAKHQSLCLYTGWLDSSFPVTVTVYFLAGKEIQVLDIFTGIPVNSAQ